MPTLDAVRRLLTAKAWNRASCIRAKTLGAAFGADPAWDMLLNIYIASCEGRRLSITSASHAGMVPPTTGLRWIKALEQAGWLARSHHPDDRRGSLLNLTVDGLAKIEQALDAVVDSDRRLGLERMRFRD